MLMLKDDFCFSWLFPICYGSNVIIIIIIIIKYLLSDLFDLNFK